VNRRMGSGIRSRLILGFGFVLVLLALAGTVGWRSMTSLTHAIRHSMQGVEQDARLSAMLATDVAREHGLPDGRLAEAYQVLDTTG